MQVPNILMLWKAGSQFEFTFHKTFSYWHLAKSKIWHIISTYAPQQGCTEEEKDAYREKLEGYMERIPRTERIVIAGDMNAQVGENCDGYERVHGGLGFIRRNLEGERLLEVAEIADMTILNTMFKKRRNHLITYKSGGNETQIDYIMVRKEDRKFVMDCKLIPGEPVVAQHRLLMADLRMKIEKKRRKEERKRKINVWERRGEKKTEFRQKVEGTLIERYGNGSFPERVGELWTDMKDILVTKATEVCGKTSGKPRKKKDTWWWNDEVQREIKEKKLALQQRKKMKMT